MDVDAGRYLTGTPMDELTAETFDLTVRVASGEPTAGERAGHSQVSIWRNWRQTGPSNRHLHNHRRPPDPQPRRPPRAEDRDAPLAGIPLALSVSATCQPGTPSDSFKVDDRDRAEAVGLILPTSLCSGQIALRLAAQAELERWAGDAVTRMVALPHTEGCGSSGGASEETFARTMLGYLLHPNTRMALAPRARLREDPQRLLPLPPRRGRRGPLAIRLGQHPGGRRPRRCHQPGPRLVQQLRPAGPRRSPPAPSAR